jgi:N6-L-threonylcarbamoyladenine synthase
MLVLGIESSCDETAAAVVGGGRILSNVVASQVQDHARYGGVMPEIASRKHLENIDRVVAEALAEAGVDLGRLDGIAVTRGPGLVGSLLVGLSYAKAVALGRGLPLAGVNHIEAHVAALALEHRGIEYPSVALVVSGGHTALYLQRAPLHFRLLGRTRDDAVGEAFDKVARLLGLGYPGGPAIDRLARGHDPARPVFPRPRMSDASLDFSFSGLKSAVARHVREAGIGPCPPGGEPSPAIRDVAAAFQKAAVATLTDNLRRALLDWRPRSLLLAGGVACNSLLRAETTRLGADLRVATYLPSPALSTDNAAMVAALGELRLLAGTRDGVELDAEPGLLTGIAAEVPRVPVLSSPE